MIIACPSCSAPYQLRDGDVAPLVQVECPACQYRIILDFEAANDPSLVEAGTQTTNAFRDEAAYNEHGSATPAAAAPAARPAHAPAPAAAAPVGSGTKPFRPGMLTPPAPQHTPVPSPLPGPKPATLEPATPVSPVSPATPVRPAPASSAPELEIIEPIEVIEPAAAQAPSEPEADEVDLDVEVEAEIDATASQAEMVAEAVERAAERMPPHTPSAAPSSVAPEGEDIDPSAPLDAGLSNADLQVESTSNTPSPAPKPEGGRSFFKSFFIFLVLLVLVAAGVLVTLSYMETGDPNPMPLIESLLAKAQAMMNGTG